LEPQGFFREFYPSENRNRTLDSIAKFVGYVFLVLFGIGILGQYHGENVDGVKPSTPATSGASAEETADSAIPAPVLFMDVDRHIPSGDAGIVHFETQQRLIIKMVARIDKAVPLDIITTPGKVSKQDYMASAAASEAASTYALFLGHEPGEEFDLFDNGMSVQRVKGEFESPWVMADVGVYSIIFDNTDSFTPPRGDTSINVRLYYRPLQ
jgi:hypothetical protein